MEHTVNDTNENLGAVVLSGSLRPNFLFTVIGACLGLVMGILLLMGIDFKFSSQPLLGGMGAVFVLLGLGMLGLGWSRKVVVTIHEE